MLALLLPGGVARPAPGAVPAGGLERQLVDLASDEFATRQKPEEALAREGEPVRAALTTALAEAQAVLALEARGSPEARRLLKAVANGQRGARLTEEAKAALGCLEAR